MQLKTFIVSAVLPCLLSSGLGLKREEGEDGGAEEYQTASGAGLNSESKEGGLIPKSELVELKPKTKEAGLNPKNGGAGLIPKSKEEELDPKIKEAKPSPKIKEAVFNLRSKESGFNAKAKEAKVSAGGRNVTESRGVPTSGSLRNDTPCTSAGGICQRTTYICQGRYLEYRCAGPRTRQCCVSGPRPWGTLCSGHHLNRVRGCDAFGCGAFGSKRGGQAHKAVDVVCDDYSVINAPFQGTLGGPAQWQGSNGIHYDGVKLSNSEFCVKIFNVRPYLFRGGVSRGQALGYLLPLQERFSGITSHLRLQTCDLSDPSPFI